MKKNIFKTMLMVTLAGVLCFTMAGCGSSGKNLGSSSTNQSTQASGQGDLGKNKSQQSSLQRIPNGTYVFEQTGPLAAVNSYTFNGNKISKRFETSAGISEGAGTYELNNGILKVIYDAGDTAGSTYEYKYTLDGNTLTMNGLEFIKK